MTKPANKMIDASRILQLSMISLLCATITTNALPTLFSNKPAANVGMERPRTIRFIPSAEFPSAADVIFAAAARKRALDSLEGDDFALHKRALDVMEGDGFGFEKRSSFGGASPLEEGGDEGFVDGFRKRALDAIEGDGFGGLVMKRTGTAEESHQQQLRQAVQALTAFRRLRRALDALEGTSFGF